MIKTKESIFQVILFDVYFDSLVWFMSYSQKFTRWDLDHSQRSGGDLNTVASLLVESSTHSNLRKHMQVVKIQAK